MLMYVHDKVLQIFTREWISKRRPYSTEQLKYFTLFTLTCEFWFDLLPENMKIYKSFSGDSSQNISISVGWWCKNVPKCGFAGRWSVVYCTIFFSHKHGSNSALNWSPPTYQKNTVVTENFIKPPKCFCDCVGFL